jgi:vacuolar protein sorting-associated protein 26
MHAGNTALLCCPNSGLICCCRLYLSPYDLTPTYRDIHNKFSVRYFLNLVLVDEEDRRYFKQQEIVLYRKADDQQQQQQGAPPSLGSS